MCDLNDKVVLLTGASSGIGAETAVHCARAGARLCLVSRRQDKLDEVATQCKAAGSPQVVTCSLDLAEAANCVRAVNYCIEVFQGLDVLIWSAGMAISGSILDISVEDYDTVMNLNTRAAFAITKECMQHLIKSKGNVVLVSSVMSLRCILPGNVAYSMSKAALDELARAVSLEVGPHGVRINSVNPGLIDTGMADKAGIPEEFIAEQRKKYPLGRIGSVNEVAEGIVFLASDRRASFITGHHLVIGGGIRHGNPRQ